MDTGILNFFLIKTNPGLLFLLKVPIFIHLFDSGLLLIIDLNKNLNFLFINLLLMIQLYITHGFVYHIS
jgi:hypothetical protein